VRSSGNVSYPTNEPSILDQRSSFCDRHMAGGLINHLSSANADFIAIASHSIASCTTTSTTWHRVKRDDEVTGIATTRLRTSATRLIAIRCDRVIAHHISLTGRKEHLNPRSLRTMEVLQSRIAMFISGWGLMKYRSHRDLRWCLDQLHG
jgi:hypothetical protein